MQPPVALDARTARILPWLVAIAFFMRRWTAPFSIPRCRPWPAHGREPFAHAGCGDRLHAHGGVADSGIGLDRRSFRQPADLCRSHRAVFLGSLLCALSTSFNQLVASRVLQALGGALMLPVGRLVVLRAFPRSEFVRIMAFIALPGLVGPLLGPTLGGWLVEYASRHWIF